VTVIHAYLDFGESDKLGFLYLVIGWPFKTYVYYKLFNHKRQLIIQQSFRSIKEEILIE